MSTDFYKNIPKKRMAVGVILMDGAGRFLLVKPTYKEGWLLPGGIVEGNESLAAACRREVMEEIGIEISTPRLLCVDYMADQEDKGDSLQIVFYGGVVDPAHIKCDAKEISEARFVTLAEAADIAAANTLRRLPHALRAIEEGAVYIEGGEALAPSTL